MNFVSFDYFLLFVLALPLYFASPQRFKWIILLLASCIFYAAFIPSYLLVLFLLILIDYYMAIKINASGNRKKWLIISISANLLLLGIFKYLNFFVLSVNGTLGTSFPLHHMVLPLGLSFHTFQSMSYTIEVYKGRQEPIRHLGIYAVYVLFFPQLVAGPIERPQNMFPQFLNSRPFSLSGLYSGLQLITIGFFKKVVIADRVSDYVDAAYAYPSSLNGMQALTAIFFFSIQIYADFSGYSDIARGSARCFGYNLSLNFDSPYLSRNLREFWTKWHISLYSWFRDYLYIPLGGGKQGELKTARNNIITFGLSGLWHGAGTNFIAWGLIHAMMLNVGRFLGRFKLNLLFPKIVSCFFTFLLVSVTWTFFRANSMSDALDILSAATSLNWNDIDDWKLGIYTATMYGNYSLAFIGFASILMLYIDKLAVLREKQHIEPLHWLAFSLLTLIVIVFGTFNAKSFIYFQF